MGTSKSIELKKTVTGEIQGHHLYLDENENEQKVYTVYSPKSKKYYLVFENDLKIV